MAQPKYKLPAAFVTRHRAELEGWDWVRDPEMPLANLCEDLAGYFLERVGDGSDMKVRSKGPHAMVRVRNYTNGLEGS
jgi:hypothetical protein